jgi:hypothetical protein
MDLVQTIECGWIILQLLGIAAAWMVRIQTGMKMECLAEGLFLFCFALIALATIAGHQYSSSMWILSATTLSIMIVTVVLDFSTTETRDSNVSRA